MSTNLSIKGKTQGGDSVTTTINYVNPSATSEQLQSLASAMNALTLNTISDVTRIDKTSLTGTALLPRNMILRDDADEADVTTVAWADLRGFDLGGISYLVKGNGLDISKLQVTFSGDASAVLTTLSEGIFLSVVKNTESSTPYVGTITVTMPADATYQAGFVTLTITA